MNQTRSSCFPVKPGFWEALTRQLAIDHELWSAHRDNDGVCRWQQTFPRMEDTPFPLPDIPLKKFLIPHNETLWSWCHNRFEQPASSPLRAVFGVALCDLQALWYLDQVFAEEGPYQQHRKRLLVIGGACPTGVLCRCRPEETPIAGDLYLASGHAWTLSERGQALLSGLSGWLGGECDLPLPTPQVSGEPRECTSEANFRNSREVPLWTEEGRHCLACGACSAVCPTCYCYDLVDRTDLAGQSKRLRMWDNCFFSSHAKVAGGHDFRPGPAERLRFRFEHKYLGFGPLRGRPSCVGCGRCLPACPAGIDLDRIARQINGRDT